MSKTVEDIALSYDRFSNLHQGEGDSEDRQNRAFASFIQRHNLQPSKEYSFIDRGLSGYDGTHRDKGELGRLLEIAKTGVFKPRRGQPGYVLVIEAWDRLGRLRPDKMIDLIRDVLACGIRIGICRLDDIFEERDFGSHKWIVLSTFVHLAHQESKQKSERIRGSYLSRIAKAREDGTSIGQNLPAWLEIVNGEQREIPERVATIKRIFELAKTGCSPISIIKTFTEEQVPAFGEFKLKGKRSQFAGVWTRSYVHLILNDRRVLGEHQPTTTDEEGKRVPNGPPIKNYFKAIIDEDDFRLARTAREGNHKGYTGPRQSKHINVFRGMLVNAVNGEGYVLINKGSKVKCQLVLCNRDGYGGRANCLTFPYTVLERALITELREVPASVLASAHAAPANEVDVVDAKLKDVREQIAALKDDLRQGYSREITAVLREKEQEETKLQEQHDSLLGAAANPPEAAWNKFGTLADVLYKSSDPVGIRIRLRSVLKRSLENIYLLLVKNGRYFHCQVQVYFAGGKARRCYQVVYRAGTRFMSSRYFVRSERSTPAIDSETGEEGWTGLFPDEDLRTKDGVYKTKLFLENYPVDMIEKLLTKYGQDL